MDGPWFYLALAALGSGIGLLYFTEQVRLPQNRGIINSIALALMMASILGITLLVF